ncbi:MAG: hypothetical protein ABUL62_16015 [Myxococcales bacterium]
MKIRSAFLFAALTGLSLNVSCGSDGPSSTGAAGESAVGGPVAGPADTHCEGQTPVTVEPAACTTPEGDGEGGASGDEPSAGEGGSDCNQTHDAEYGATLPNSEGDDDDCKYHASWTSTPIRLNQDVTVTVTTSNLITGDGLEALDDGELPLTRVEVYQPCDPNRFGPAQNSKAKFEEISPGVYQGGPLRFDQPGRWVVRFHFYEQCLDGAGSPHGHVAFFVDVP